VTSVVSFNDVSLLIFAIFISRYFVELYSIFFLFQRVVLPAVAAAEAEKMLLSSIIDINGQYEFTRKLYLNLK
jgi:hypothetical protein